MGRSRGQLHADRCHHLLRRLCEPDRQPDPIAGEPVGTRARDAEVGLRGESEPAPGCLASVLEDQAVEHAPGPPEGDERVELPALVSEADERSAPECAAGTFACPEVEVEGGKREVARPVVGHPFFDLDPFLDGDQGVTGPEPVERRDGGVDRRVAAVIAAQPQWTRARRVRFSRALCQRLGNVTS